jgi:branched-chain amino acid transport system ATP-binding protein
VVPRSQTRSEAQDDRGGRYGLRTRLVAHLFEAIVAIAKSGIAACLVEQDVHLSLEVAHYAYVLENGAIVAQGRGDELLHSDQIRSIYLGL